MLDARQEGNSYRRVEVITGERRRRRWTSEEKARIAAESFEEGANISEVARRNGVSRGLLTVWRRQVAAAVAGNRLGHSGDGAGNAVSEKNGKQADAECGTGDNPDQVLAKLCGAGLRQAISLVRRLNQR